jgi:hypothetical protein
MKNVNFGKFIDINLKYLIRRYYHSKKRTPIIF